MLKRKRRRLIFLSVFLLMLGLTVSWLNREIQHERDNAALIAAIKANDTTAALQALERGADANARDIGDYKPTIRERLRQIWDRLRGRKAQNGNVAHPTAIQVYLAGKLNKDDTLELYPENERLLQSLLQKGADPNVADETRRSPLYYACCWNYLAYVRLLLHYGARPTAADMAGQTPLHSAAYQSAEITRLLLEAGADPNTRSALGETPLHIVINENNWATIQVLKNDHGYNRSLYNAEVRKQREILQLLLAHGADVNAKDNQGHSPLAIAQQNHSLALVHLLKQHGAK